MKGSQLDDGIVIFGMVDLLHCPLPQVLSVCHDQVKGRIVEQNTRNAKQFLSCLEEAGSRKRLDIVSSSKFTEH